MQKEWHQAIPNLIKEEQRYINKSGNAEGERDEKTEKKTEDKQRNKMQRLWQTICVNRQDSFISES